MYKYFVPLFQGFVLTAVAHALLNMTEHAMTAGGNVVEVFFPWLLSGVCGAAAIGILFRLGTALFRDFYPKAGV